MAKLKENATLKNPDRLVGDGWEHTVKDMFDEVNWQMEMVERGETRFNRPETKEDIKKLLEQFQPYVKKPIKELVNYYCQLYGITK